MALNKTRCDLKITFRARINKHKSPQIFSIKDSIPVIKKLIKLFKSHRFHLSSLKRHQIVQNQTNKCLNRCHFLRKLKGHNKNQKLQICSFRSNSIMTMKKTTICLRNSRLNNFNNVRFATVNSIQHHIKNMWKSVKKYSTKRERSSVVKNKEVWVTKRKDE